VDSFPDEFQVYLDKKTENIAKILPDQSIKVHEWFIVKYRVTNYKSIRKIKARIIGGELKASL
jgi:hypothetical protein